MRATLLPRDLAGRRGQRWLERHQRHARLHRRRHQRRNDIGQLLIWTADLVVLAVLLGSLVFLVDALIGGTLH